MRPIITILFNWLAFTAVAQQTPLTLRVSASGNADFRTIQEALHAIPPKRANGATIYVREGVYREVVIVDASKRGIHLKGEGAERTRIVFNNHAGTKLPNGDTLNTWTCASAFIYADDFTATDITFENDAGYTAGQAVALRVEGNRSAFRNCRFVGNQDVLFLSGGGSKQYFERCYIEGTTDFIFGGATAFFERCVIHSKKNSHVTAASTNSIIPFGFVFESCMLTADSSIHKVTLGRPWSPTASVTYLNCWLGKHIIPAGWNNWRNPANELTARYAEFNSQGPGANASARCSWSKQLTEAEATQFSKWNVLKPWKPSAE